MSGMGDTRKMNREQTKKEVEKLRDSNFSAWDVIDKVVTLFADWKAPDDHIEGVEAITTVSMVAKVSDAIIPIPYSEEPEIIKRLVRAANRVCDSCEGCCGNPCMIREALTWNGGKIRVKE